jgi:antitoxin HigA-1
MNMDRKLEEIHPGEILEEEFMRPYGVTAAQIAGAVAVPLAEIEDILKCARPISADMAIHLARYFDVDAQFWINLQAEYDARTVRA